jgi:hypothetical protein
VKGASVLLNFLIIFGRRTFIIPIHEARDNLEDAIHPAVKSRGILVFFPEGLEKGERMAPFKHFWKG